MRDRKQTEIQTRVKRSGIPLMYCAMFILPFFFAFLWLFIPSSVGGSVVSPQDDAGAVEFDFIPERDEMIYAERIASEIEKESVILEDESLNDYLERIGMRIVERNNLQRLAGDWEWSFRIIDSSDMNAFAALGGQVYLNRGLIETAESESELAAILSFELGHILSRHVHQHIYQRLVRRTGFSSDDLLTGEEGWEKLSSLFMAEGGVFAFFSSLGHTSLQVEKADELALLNNFNAEFNPQAFLTLFDRLGRRERPFPRWLRRNPWSQRRKRKISASLRLLPSVTSPLAHARFREFKARLKSSTRSFSREEERQPASDQDIFLDITIMGDRDWIDTGIEVQEGQEISFSAFGTVYLQKGNIRAYCGPDGYDLKTRQQPFVDRNIGALIGKVAILLSIEVDEGSGRETRHEIRENFFIGPDITIRMPMSGQLYLGINENLVEDNEGAFSVSIVYLAVKLFPSL
jgi:Zn-dependent protease with chaperone function